MGEGQPAAGEDGPADGRCDVAAAEERDPNPFELPCASLVQARDRIRGSDDPEVAFARLVDRGPWAIREIEAAKDGGRDPTRVEMRLQWGFEERAQRGL